jgi:hypothetical protein
MPLYRSFDDNGRACSSSSSFHILFWTFMITIFVVQILPLALMKHFLSLCPTSCRYRLHTGHDFSSFHFSSSFIHPLQISLDNLVGFGGSFNANLENCVNLKLCHRPYSDICFVSPPFGSWTLPDMFTCSFIPQRKISSIASKRLR